jgi:hypothetical protein
MLFLWDSNRERVEESPKVRRELSNMRNNAIDNSYQKNEIFLFV